MATKSSNSLPDRLCFITVLLDRALEGRRRADFGSLLLTFGLGFDFFLFLLRWRGGTADGRLLTERKTVRHGAAIHKRKKVNLKLEIGDLKGRSRQGPEICHWRVGGNFMWLSSMCRPCRGFLVVFDAVSHRFRSGLRCDVPPGLPTGAIPSGGGTCELVRGGAKLHAQRICLRII
jgi:hypothetical protein